MAKVTAFETAARAGPAGQSVNNPSSDRNTAEGHLIFTTTSSRQERDVKDGLLFSPRRSALATRDPWTGTGLRFGPDSRRAQSVVRCIGHRVSANGQDAPGARRAGRKLL